MSIDALNFISSKLANAKINYEFGEWTSDIVYPYFVGEYQEIESTTEDGLQEATFILVGFSRGSWLDLEKAKETIERLFSNCTAILENGSGMAVFYNGSMIIPTGDAELKRIEIRLDIKEWKVN